MARIYFVSLVTGKVCLWMMKNGGTRARFAGKRDAATEQHRVRQTSRRCRRNKPHLGLVHKKHRMLLHAVFLFRSLYHPKASSTF